MIGRALLFCLLTWALADFYNLMEYTLTFPVAVCSGFAIDYVLSSTGVPYKSGNALDWICLLLLVVAVFATPAFIWNRRKYPRVYRVTFASVISLSAIGAVLAHLHRHERKYIHCLAVVGFTALTAFLGIKFSKEQLPEEEVAHKENSP